MENCLHNLKGEAMETQGNEVKTLEKPMQSRGMKHELAVWKGTTFSMIFPPDWKTGAAEGQFLTTVNRDRPEGRKVIMQALNGDCKSIDTVVNMQIVVAGFTVSPAYKIDRDTGEVIHFIRTVLHCTNGDNFQAFSDGVLKSLRVRHSMYGDQMFAEPVKCTPRRVPTSDSRSMYRIDWDD